MRIERKSVPRGAIEDFADQHSLTMVVSERGVPRGDPYRYYAHFKGCDVLDGPILEGTYGNGPTEHAAIRDYARRIGGKRLVFKASSECREIDAWHFDDPRTAV